MNKLTLIILLIAFISGCGSEEDNKEKTTDVGDVSGFTTTSDTGATISGVNVIVDSNSVLSATNGSYALSNVPIGSNSITATKSGFATHSGVVTVTESATTSYDILLQPKDCVQSYSGLVSWWSGDGNANDSVGTNNGQVMNGVTFAPGLVNEAFSFDGVDDIVEVQNDSTLNPTAAISVSVWVKLSDTGTYQVLVSKFIGFNGPGDDSFWLGISPNNGIYWAIETSPNGQLVDNQWETEAVDLYDGNFHLIVATYDGINMKAYFDGKIVGTKSASGNILSSPTPILIGAISNNKDEWFANGLLDEVNLKLIYIM